MSYESRRRRTLLHMAIFGIVFLLVTLIVHFIAINTPDSSAPGVSQASATSSPLYMVVKVVDGDTIKVLMDGTTTTVRLIGVDTPETVDPHRPVGCFGPEASRYMHQRLSSALVHVEPDPSQDAYDKYGRTLAYIVTADGINIDEELIAQGYGREYTYDKPYLYQAQFREAQRQAQSTGRGLWGSCVSAQ